MRIIDCSVNGYLDCAVQAAPEAPAAAVSLAAEHWMDVLINERPAMRVVCTPEHLDELTAGRLLTEGLIRGTEDLEEIYICEKGLRAKVTLREQAGARLVSVQAAPVETCCTDSRTWLTRDGRETEPVTPIPWKAGWLAGIARRMRGEEPLYGATHAVHACYLARGEEILCCREDIGRHNALDKAVGWAMIQGVDLRDCMLFTTGRMPSDMVAKAIRSRVPLLASKTYPSDLGLKLAREAGLTLVTLRPGGELTVWNDGTGA